MVSSYKFLFGLNRPFGFYSTLTHGVLMQTQTGYLVMDTIEHLSSVGNPSTTDPKMSIK